MLININYIYVVNSKILNDMKKSIFSALCLVLLATTTQSAWGATETLTFSNVGKDLPSTANTTVSTTTVNSYTFNYYQCKKQTSGSNYYAFLTKSVSPYFGNATAIPGTITSVSVTIPSGASKSTTYTIGFSTTPITSADACTTTLGKGNNTTFTAKNSVSGATYFAISLGNANNGQISSITVTYETGSTPPTLYFGQEMELFGTPPVALRFLEPHPSRCSSSP